MVLREIRDRLAEAAAVITFQGQMIDALGFFATELYKLADGKVPADVTRAMHDLLRVLSESALNIPKSDGPLAMLDRLLEMLPPVDPPE